jgi:ribosome-associated translation inhibitor RaiA
MQRPLRITFRHMEPSPGVEARIREHVDHLERFHKRITGCDVIIEAPPSHRRHGSPYEITIDLTIPGREIAVRTGQSECAAHTDVYVAIRDAFDGVKRLLHAHDVLPHGTTRDYGEQPRDISEQDSATFNPAQS